MRALQLRPFRVERLVPGPSGLAAQVKEEGDEGALDRERDPEQQEVPSRAASFIGPSASPKQAGQASARAAPVSQTRAATSATPGRTMRGLTT